MAKIKPTTRKDFVENNSSNCNFDIYCSVQLIIEPLIKSRDFFAALHPMCCSHANQQKILFMSSANRDRFFFRTFEMLLMSMTNCSQCFQADLLRVSRLFAVVATKRWSFFYRCVFFSFN